MGIKKFSFIIIALLLFIAFNPKDSFAFNSLAEYEEKTRDGFFDWFRHIDNCVTTGKAIIPYMVSDFDNASIPHILSKYNTIQTQNHATWSQVVTTGRIAAYAVLFSISGPLAFLALGIDLLMFFDVCTNATIVMPNEYVNLHLNRLQFLGCNNEEQRKQPPFLTADDVPFFYHCEATWDPDKGGYINDEGSDEQKKYYESHVGKTWGYMGSASIYCNNVYGKILKDEYQDSDLTSLQLKEKIGGAIIYYRSLWDRMFKSSHNKCDGLSGYKDYKKYDGDSKSIIKPKPGSTSGEGIYQFFAYYTYDTENSKIKLCVAAPYTLTPVKIGCTYVPPPASDNSGIMPFVSIINDTRCMYLVNGREDLHTLGKNLPITDNDGRNRTALIKFLKSELHITSTIVGCMLDLLDKLFFPKDAYCAKDRESFFQKVQKNFTPIVFASLILYVTLIGVKILTSPTTLKRSEFLIYAVKFALVLYFATGSGWYQYDEKTKEEVGIYPALINGSQMIGSFFLGAQNDNDPIGYCKYRIYKRQLLSQTDFPVESFHSSAVKPTLGTCGKYVRMTMWDLIDCKLINYINFGSCDYSLTGIIGAWLVTAVILLGGVGIILFIGSFIYCFMLLKIIFQFTHIFLLSMFTITILVVGSPIILCFALFGYTKGIFDKWVSVLLGYMIYPALNFAFIALMLATFDSVYYGDINIDQIDDPSAAVKEQTVENLCKSTTSAFCVLYKYVNLGDLCRKSFDDIVGSLVDEYKIIFLGKFAVLKLDLALDYLQVIWKLCLFAFLFYLLMGAVDNYMALLTNVMPLGSEVPSSVDVSKYAKKGFGAILNAATLGLAQGAKKGLNKVKENMAKGGKDKK